MYLNLGLSMTLKDFKLFRIGDVDFDSTIDEFKIRVAESVNFLKENFELCYAGRILEGSSSLSNNGLKEGFVLNVLQKKEKEASLTSLPALESEIPDLVRVFQILATRNAYRRILQKLNKPEVLENIISTTPGLNDDATAIVILQHPELLAKLGDAAAVKRVLEKHPTLANAARNLVAAVQNDMLTSPSPSVVSHSLNNSVSFVVGSDDEEMEFLGNGDTESRTSDNSTEGELPVNLITTSQVAAALANTASTTRSPSDSSSTTAGAPSASSITPEMMSAAIERVIASTSTANVGTSSENNEEQHRSEGVVTEAKLEQLRRLGFTNDAINIQALQIVSGDLEMAVNLILNGLNEDS